MIDMQAILEQAKNFQKQHQQDLAKLAFSSSSGGGAVNVVINGNKELTKIEFTPDAMEDPDMLADMVLAAVNGAYAEADRDLAGRMPALDNLDLSSLSNLFK